MKSLVDTTLKIVKEKELIFDSQDLTFDKDTKTEGKIYSKKEAPYEVFVECIVTLPIDTLNKFNQFIKTQGPVSSSHKPLHVTKLEYVNASPAQ